MSQGDAVSVRGKIPISVRNTPISVGHTPISVGHSSTSVRHIPISVGHTHISVGHSHISLRHTFIRVGHTHISVEHSQHCDAGIRTSSLADGPPNPDPVLCCVVFEGTRGGTRRTRCIAKACPSGRRAPAAWDSITGVLGAGCGVYCRMIVGRVAR